MAANIHWVKTKSLSVVGLCFSRCGLSKGKSDGHNGGFHKKVSHTQTPLCTS